MQQIQAQVESQALVEIAQMASLCQRYIEYMDIRENSLRTYATALRQFIKWITENQIRQPQRQDVIQFREDMGQTRKAATVQTYMIAVRQFFRWTAEEGLYPNIADNVKGVNVSKLHKKDALTKKQAQDVLKSLKDREDLRGLRDYAIILTAMAGGLRTIEIVRANKGDLRARATDQEDLHVLYLQGKGRDDADEFVVIPEEVFQAIQKYQRARGKTKASAPLFASISNRNPGGRMTTRSASRIVKNAFIACGLDSDRLTAHSLRHTAATLALREGEPIQDVQQFLRHTNIDTTMIYIQEQAKIENKGSRTVTAALFEKEGEDNGNGNG